MFKLATKVTHMQMYYESHIHNFGYGPQRKNRQKNKGSSGGTGNETGRAGMAVKY